MLNGNEILPVIRENRQLYVNFLKHCLKPKSQKKQYVKGQSQELDAASAQSKLAALAEEYSKMIDDGSAQTDTSNYNIFAVSFMDLIPELSTYKKFDLRVSEL